MAKYGYIVYEIRASVRGRKEDHVKLDNLDGKGTDFMDALGRVLQKHKNRTIEHTGTEYAHEIGDFSRDNRFWTIQGTSGPYGMVGNARNLDTDEIRPFDRRTAMMIDLRSLIYSPESSHKAYLICERVSARIFRSPIERTILEEIGKDNRVSFQVIAHVDYQAWLDFLERSQVYEITATYLPRHAEDMGEGPRRSSKMRISATGGLANRFGRNLIPRFIRMHQEEDPESIGIEEFPELSPNDPSRFDRKKITAQVGKGAEKRTVTVDEGELPQFVYPMEERMETDDLVSLWRSHIARGLS